MIFFTLLFVFCVVNTDGAVEGDSCTKNGVPGVCTPFRQCPDALKDVENRIKPQHCTLGTSIPIVCCISSAAATPPPTVITERPHTGKCILPPYPRYGTYVANVPNGKPGDSFDVFVINVTCNPGYEVDRSRTVFCQDGWWPEPMPNCVLACHLASHPSVDYTCMASVGGVNVSRPCRGMEPHGIVATPHCRAPHYSSSNALGVMNCVYGQWDYVATCDIECGIITPHEAEQFGTKTAKRGEVPWHVGVYTKNKNSYMQICGGSLVSSRVVISAAHCFWNDAKGQLPASDYAVGVGKLYRAWDHVVDEDQAQYSDIKEIRLPLRFQGAAARYQDDLAVLIVSTPFELKSHIWPACLDFDTNIENRQLQPGNKGKFAGWGFSHENGTQHRLLKFVEVPYVSTEKCRAEVPSAFISYITSDKFCAGAKDGSAPLCKGDSGGGVAFASDDKGIPRYYLRGILSTAPQSENLCNTKDYTGFTQLSKHESFIKQYMGSE